MPYSLGDSMAGNSSGWRANALPSTMSTGFWPSLYSGFIGNGASGYGALANTGAFLGNLARNGMGLGLLPSLQRLNFGGNSGTFNAAGTGGVGGRGYGLPTSQGVGGTSMLSSSQRNAIGLGTPGYLSGYGAAVDSGTAAFEGYINSRYQK